MSNQTEDPQSPLDTIRIAPHLMTSVTFYFPAGHRAVTLHEGGRVEVGEGVTYDEAAKCFWDAVLRNAPRSK